ncbi:MAG: glycosyltransferase [Lutibacter sp.]|nr:glycosyltransferase [Lutibacter sp.]
MKVISIITITLNNKLGLYKTIKSLSCINRNFFDYFEHIIVDGLSSDNTTEYIESYLKSPTLKTKYISEVDDGIYSAMNKGVELCNGQVCFFLNSGDLLGSKFDPAVILSKIENGYNTFNLAGFAFNVNLISKGSSYLVRSRHVRKWRLRMPAVHQGIVYNVAYLMKYRYDESLLICGDFKSVVTALNNGFFFKVVDADLALLNLGGISTQRPLLLLKESIMVIFKSSNKTFYKFTSCFFVIVNVFLFQIRYRILSMFL